MLIKKKTKKNPQKTKNPDIQGHIIWFYSCEMSRIGESIESECRLIVCLICGTDRQEENEEKLFCE